MHEKSVNASLSTVDFLLKDRSMGGNTTPSSIHLEFQHAQEFLETETGKERFEQLSQEKSLQLYAYYQQAMKGSCKSLCPAYDNSIEYAQWKAWKDLKSISKKSAMGLYIELLDEELSEWRIYKATKSILDDQTLLVSSEATTKSSISLSPLTEKLRQENENSYSNENERIQDQNLRNPNRKLFQNSINSLNVEKSIPKLSTDIQQLKHHVEEESIRLSQIKTTVENVIETNKTMSKDITFDLQETQFLRQEVLTKLQTFEESIQSHKKTFDTIQSNCQQLSQQMKNSMTYSTEIQVLSWLQKIKGWTWKHYFRLFTRFLITYFIWKYWKSKFQRSFIKYK